MLTYAQAKGDHSPRPAVKVKGGLQPLPITFDPPSTPTRSTPSLRDILSNFAPTRELLEYASRTNAYVTCPKLLAILCSLWPSF